MPGVRDPRFLPGSLTALRPDATQVVADLFGATARSRPSRGGPPSLCTGSHRPDLFGTIDRNPSKGRRQRQRPCPVGGAPHDRALCEPPDAPGDGLFGTCSPPQQPVHRPRRLLPEQPQRVGSSPRRRGRSTSPPCPPDRRRLSYDVHVYGRSDEPVRRLRRCPASLPTRSTAPVQLLSGGWPLVASADHQRTPRRRPEKRPRASILSAHAHFLDHLPAPCRRRAPTARRGAAHTHWRKDRRGSRSTGYPDGRALLAPGPNRAPASWHRTRRGPARRHPPPVLVASGTETLPNSFEHLLLDTLHVALFPRPSHNDTASSQAPRHHLDRRRRGPLHDLAPLQRDEAYSTSRHARPVAGPSPTASPAHPTAPTPANTLPAHRPTARHHRHARLTRRA